MVHKKVYIPIEDYIDDYVNKRITVAEIAKKYKVSNNTINTRINEYYILKGEERPQIKYECKNKKHIDIEKYIRDYEDSKISIIQIAIKEGVSRTTIKNRLNEYYKLKGIREPEVKFKGKSQKNINIEKYIKDYEEFKIKISQIAHNEGVCETTIRNRIKEYYETIGKENPVLNDKCKKKQIHFIEKYIEDYESGKISAGEIAEKENVLTYFVYNKIREYYKITGRKRIYKNTVRNDIDISKYVSDFEKGKITVHEIALAENISDTAIYKRLDKYYEKIGKKRPKKERIINKEKGKTDKKDETVTKVVNVSNIENYIKCYESGEMTIKEIAEKEKLSMETIKKRMLSYYHVRGKNIPQIVKPKDAIKVFLKRGMTKEQIKEAALKRNKIILDSDFEEIEEEIKQEEQIYKKTEGIEK